MKKRQDFFQSAWVVRDLEAAINQWIKQGVGPFFVVPHSQVENFVYRGRPSKIDFSVALAQSGAIQIELIQQHDDKPSQYRDVFQSGESGFHHMCRFTSDFDADIDQFLSQGDRIACTAQSGDMRFAYIDTRASIGCMTEILEDRPWIRAMFNTVSEGAANWDGSEPVRHFT